MTCHSPGSRTKSRRKINVRRLPGALFDTPAERFDNVAHTIASRVTENGARFLPISERRGWLMTADQPRNVQLAPLARQVISSERRLHRTQTAAFTRFTPLPARNEVLLISRSAYRVSSRRSVGHSTRRYGGLSADCDRRGRERHRDGIWMILGPTGFVQQREGRDGDVVWVSLTSFGLRQRARNCCTVVRRRQCSVAAMLSPARLAHAH